MPYLFPAVVCTRCHRFNSFGAEQSVNLCHVGRKGGVPLGQAFGLFVLAHPAHGPLRRPANTMVRRFPWHSVNIRCYQAFVISSCSLVKRGCCSKNLAIRRPGVPPNIDIPRRCTLGLSQTQPHLWQCGVRPLFCEQLLPTGWLRIIMEGLQWTIYKHNVCTRRGNEKIETKRGIGRVSAGSSRIVIQLGQDCRLNF